MMCRAAAEGNPDFPHSDMISTFRRASLAALGCALLLGCGRNTPFPRLGVLAAKLAGAHHFDHIVIIVLENENANRVEAVPYMDSLARIGAALRDYYAVAHPSYPNYLAMVSGNTFIDDDSRVQPDPNAYSRRDFGDAQMVINAPSLADRFQSAKLSWNVFAEDYPVDDSVPKACDFRQGLGLYSRKHVPFLSFAGFRQHLDWCAHVRNLKWFRADSLAAYTFITPNLVHDGHDAPLSDAVAWLRKFLTPLLANADAMKSTVVFITFDETATSNRERVFGTARPNLVYAALLGGPIKLGTISTDVYSHFSLLRTVEQNFGLSPSLAPSGVNAFDGVWR